MIPTLFLLALVIQEPTPVPLPSPEPKPSVSPPWEGSVALRYRARWTADERDQDLREIVSARLGDPERNDITASFSARFAEDLDGTREVAGFYVFDSVADTYRRSATGSLYTAFIEHRAIAPGVSLRVGRQLLDEIPEALSLDGGRALWRVSERVEAALFGGRPVNPFESSPAGDFMGGGWISAEPWKRGRVRLEYLRLRDETLFGLFKDDLYGLAVEQGGGPVRATARYTRLEGESRDATANMGLTLPESGWIADVRATYVFETQHALSTAIDPYTVFLLDLDPYVQADARVAKDLGVHWTIEGSGMIRRLARGAEESDYNHDFNRWGIAVRVRDAEKPVWSASATVDRWTSPERAVATLGGDVSWEPTRALRFTAGSSYALYRIDAFTGEERQDVRTAHLSARWKPAEGTWIDLKLRTDLDEFERISAVEAGVRHAF